MILNMITVLKEKGELLKENVGEFVETHKGKVVLCVVSVGVGVMIGSLLAHKLGKSETKIETKY